MNSLIRTLTTLAGCAALGSSALMAATAARADASGGERRFDLSGFDAIALEGSDDVVVRTDGRPGAVATGDPRALAALRLEVRDGVLHVGRLRGSWHDRGAIVTVTVPALKAVSLAGSGNLDVGAVIAPAFEGRLSGSGDLRLGSLRARAARFRLSGSGDVTLAGVSTETLALGLVGSGDVRAAGQAGQVAIDVSGSGDVDAARLSARDVTIGVAGSGDVSARASGQATIEARGSGDVTVTGGARCIVAKHGSADVRCG